MKNEPFSLAIDGSNDSGLQKMKAGFDVEDMLVDLYYWFD